MLAREGKRLSGGGKVADSREGEGEGTQAHSGRTSANARTHVERNGRQFLQPSRCDLEITRAHSFASLFPSKGHMAREDEEEEGKEGWLPMTITRSDCCCCCRRYPRQQQQQCE